MARKKHEQAACGAHGAVTITAAAQMLGLVDPDGKPKRTLVRYYATQDKLDRVDPACEGCRMVLVTLASVRRLQQEMSGKSGTVAEPEAAEQRNEGSDDPWSEEI